mmetsp:Transcript_20190/g.60902  ORF Transcript_20190/g.60902 Transcript_20190/m.60902 type:complete len:541 (-) Transcript_20190:7-1629(-)|eukprot:CAMPEP_0206137266 /NCGR_PEP_ID=MMETSP1473-20131121/2419_1 /ASSEMBLY_ACC=CAM_ASM_001109 /TAXON_ID=1461547 /ORGANISM="Stichococcus sp, Strain RCC1054" /LENGTH=540 /DNA_ID=CAMNT_0053530265 /DNA_START=332 /DNA_END=1954 /DNA_ORIENTATION=+
MTPCVLTVILRRLGSMQSLQTSICHNCQPCAGLTPRLGPLPSPHRRRWYTPLYSTVHQSSTRAATLLDGQASCKAVSCTTQKTAVPAEEETATSFEAPATNRHHHNHGEVESRFLGTRRQQRSDEVPIRLRRPKTYDFDNEKWAHLVPLPPNTRAPEGELYERERRALWRHLNSRDPWTCPACRQEMFQPKVFAKHLSSCCADLFDGQVTFTTEAIAQLDAHSSLQPILADASVQNAALMKRVLDLAYRQVDEAGQQIRRSPDVVADLLQLPEKRIRTMLRLAMKDIPLVHEEIPLEILYEDEHLLALNKPPGVLTTPNHRYAGGSMVNQILPYLGTTGHVLHRLDRDTSGVLLVGKSLLATREIHRQFRRRTIGKTYLAIAAGMPTEAQFTVDAAIGRHATEKLARATQGGRDGQEARTAFRVLSSSPSADLQGASSPLSPVRKEPIATMGACLVQCFPLTGRTHQIRVHLGHAGHPIIGDEIYGLRGDWIGRQALHAATLQVEHPATGEPITFTAPPKQDFKRAMDMLGLTYNPSQIQ